jgi:hypothetical protein
VGSRLNTDRASFTRLLVQNHDVFTDVLFTIHPCAPTSPVDIVARTSSSSVYDYFLNEYDYFINKYNYSVLRSTTF